MTVNRKRAGWILSVAVAMGAAAVRAQDESPQPTKEHLQKEEQLMDAAKSMGPWESQTQLIEEATDNIFSQQGWNSESDKFARDLMRQVGQVAPWDPQQREEIFMNGVQSRYSLTYDQRTQVAGDIRREAMTMTFKHFKDVFPVALDIAKTRAQNKPFSPEQVQEWSRKLKPVFDDTLNAAERVTGKLERTLSPEQRQQLAEDMKAFRRRQGDVLKMVDKWEQGKWTPADWGLQNDPLHSGMVAEQAALDATRNALVAEKQLAQTPDEQRVATQESAWDQYVKWFCKNYQCDDKQRTMAASILASSKKDAVNIRNARRDVIQQYERALGQAESPERQQAISKDLQKALEPIAQTFDRMKSRLYEQVLTTEQRIKFTPAKTVKAPAPAAPRSAHAQKSDQ